MGASCCVRVTPNCAPPQMDSPAQMVAGFVGAVAMGAMFGLIFGLMNVMQDAPGQMERQRGEIVLTRSSPAHQWIRSRSATHWAPGEKLRFGGCQKSRPMSPPFGNPGAAACGAARLAAGGRRDGRCAGRDTFLSWRGGGRQRAPKLAAGASVDPGRTDSSTRQRGGRRRGTMTLPVTL